MMRKCHNVCATADCLKTETDYKQRACSEKCAKRLFKTQNFFYKVLHLQPGYLTMNAQQAKRLKISRIIDYWYNILVIHILSFRWTTETGRCESMRLRKHFTVFASQKSATTDKWQRVLYRTVKRRLQDERRHCSVAGKHRLCIRADWLRDLREREVISAARRLSYDAWRSVGLGHVNGELPLPCYKTTFSSPDRLRHSALPLQ